MEVMRIIGISKAGIAKVFQTQDPDKRGSQYPTYKDLLALVKEFQVRQLFPGKQLDELMDPALDFLSQRIDPHGIAGRETWYTTVADDGTLAVSLFEWISDLFIGFGQEAYFGKKLGEIEPDLVQTFQEFDAAAWQVLYQYPSFLSQGMLKKKSKIQAAMERYFALPVKERSDAAWLTLELEKEMKRLAVSDHDRALFFFQMYWR